MKRELLFRSWGGKQMTTGVHPDFTQEEPHCLAPDQMGNFIIGPTGKKGFWYSIPVKAIMQFTGLKDKEDKKIFEGDILRWGENNDKLIKCVWEGAAIFAMYLDEKPLEGIATNLKSFNPVWERHTEVIGNIYENPELLKS